MPTIVHLSDLHVSERPDHRFNVRLAGIVRWIVARYPRERPIVVVTGDLVDDGTQEQYERLVDLLAPLKGAGFRILAVPGNHDSGPMGNAYYASSRVYFQRYVVAGLMGISVADSASDLMEALYPLVHRIDGVTYIGLDSVAGMIFAGMHFARGAIGAAQLAKLKAILDHEDGKQPIVVYLHHHPRDRKFTLALRDAHALRKTLADRCTLLLFGHRHRSETWPGGVSPLIAERVELAAGRTTEASESQRCEVREACLVDGTCVVNRLQIPV